MTTTTNGQNSNYNLQNINIDNIDADETLEDIENAFSADAANAALTSLLQGLSDTGGFSSLQELVENASKGGGIDSSEEIEETLNQLGYSILDLFPATETGENQRALALQLLAQLQKNKSDESKTTAFKLNLHALSSNENMKAQAANYQQAVKDASHKHSFWGKFAHVMMADVIPAVMIAVGVITGNAALVAMGAITLIMSHLPDAVVKLGQAVSKGLQDLGVPKEAANFAGAVLAIAVVAAMAFAGGEAMLGEEAGAELGEIAEGAASEASPALEEAAEDKASSIVDKVKELTEKIKMKPSKALSLMVGSIALSEESPTIATSMSSVAPKDSKLQKRLQHTLTALMDLMSLIGSGVSMVGLTSGLSSTSSLLADTSEQLKYFIRGQ